MTITITQEHIDKGTKGSARCCPVALAINDAGFRDSSVGCNSFCTTQGRWFWKKDYYGLLPNQVFLFICAFDMNSKVDPLTFEIEMTKC